MSDLLSPDDLAYMRATQAEARPTEATLVRRVSTRTSTGGQTDTWPGPGDPVGVRLSGGADQVPEVLAARYAQDDLVKITLDLVYDVRKGDRLLVTDTEAYEVVTSGDPSRWATAQQVWGRRYLYPAR